MKKLLLLSLWIIMVVIVSTAFAAKGKIKIEGAGIIKRHQRANPQSNRGGGIIEKESYIDISNVQLIDPQSGKPTRVKYHVENDGTKTRMAAGSGHSIEK